MALRLVALTVPGLYRAAVQANRLSDAGSVLAPAAREFLRRMVRKNSKAKIPGTGVRACTRAEFGV
jgi:hypothetical protein